MPRVCLITAALCVAAFASSPAWAQDLVFTNDPGQLREPFALKAMKENADVPIFKSGDPVFGVWRMANARRDLTAVTIPRDGGARKVTVTWSFLNASNGYTQISSRDYLLTPDQVKRNHFPFTLVPDTYDPASPGFAEFLSFIRAKGGATGRGDWIGRFVRENETRILIKVRVENDAREWESSQVAFNQAPFYFDFSAGAGRYAEWRLQHDEAVARQKADAASARCVPREPSPARVSGSIRAIAVSPDGKLLASARDGGVTLWNAATGEEVASLRHSARVRAVAFSADGTRLVSGDASGCAVIWNLAANNAVRGFHVDSIPGIISLALTTSGDLLVVGSDYPMVFDVASGKTLGRGPRDENEKLYGQVRVAASPNGKTFAAGDSFGSDPDGQVSVYETSTVRRLGTLKGFEKAVTAVTYSPDGNLLATGGGDSRVRVWDLQSATEKHKFSRESELVNSVAFSRDGTLLASGNGGGEVFLREVASGKEVRSIKVGEAVYTVAFSADGKSVFAGGLNGTITVWDASSGSQVRRIPQTSGLIIK